MTKPSVIVVDDHQIFRKGLVSLLENENIATVLGEACNGIEFLTLLDSTTNPGIVLIDINMPEMDGEEATRRALAKNPNLKFIALSMYGDEGNYYKMVNAGVKGFLLKNCDLTELETAIKTINSGDTYFSNELLRNIIAKFGKQATTTEVPLQLTEREIEVLKLICSGFTNEEIAEKLCISSATVKGHRTHLLEKTQCKNTAALIMFSIRNKLVLL